ncbi:MAG TPA: aminotransferase class I/II-fold pyridoxal phosphate-dependent enzyme [Candidatus Aminicenantes bacterium]|nr:aminotransferase class I/II-fold pyridoxal phosphate-dependent enzyme [Candidatus Aminicenantes bacterium]
MKEIHPRATELNRTIETHSPTVLHLLSGKGRSIYFPRSGILAQGAEAAGCAINATIGTALEEDGSPLRLQTIAKHLNLKPEEAFPYAPSPGLPALRDRWAQRLLEKNPTLAEKPISRPLVCQAITHGLSLLGALFVDPGDIVLHPDLFWGNYRLVFGHARDARLAPYPLFHENGLDLDGFSKSLQAGPPSQRRTVILNFPNNPTGYTPTREEIPRLREILAETAQKGYRLLVILDDAYYGLVYEDNVYRESLFAELADLHENLLAVKVDGATKEEYAWGFRVGFITYGIRGGNTDLYAALEEKTAGMLRGNISSASRLSQSLILNALNDPGYMRERNSKFFLMRQRYREVRRILATHPEACQWFTPLPCNSGYFICLRLVQANAEAVRRRLLNHYDTGVIALDGMLRIAFSSTPTHRLQELFDNILSACRDLATT